MSSKTTVEVTCPACGAKHKVSIWKSINTTLDPEMKQAVRDRSAFLFTCPSCGYQTHLSYGFLYYQMEDGILIHLANSEKNAEEINSIKQNNKKKTVFNDIINKEKNNNNLFSNQTISYNSHKSDIKENNKENINLNNKEKIKTDFVKNYINKLNETNNLDIRKINSLKQNIPKSNTNSNFLKLKNINSEKSLSNHLRNDSYCNSIENHK